MHGQKTAVWRVRGVFGPVGVKHQIAGLQDCAVAFVQRSFMDQGLFIPVMLVAARPYTGGLPVDVKADAQRVGVELQDRVAQSPVILVDEGGESGVMEVGNLAVSFANVADGGSFQVRIGQAGGGQFKMRSVKAQSFHRWPVGGGDHGSGLQYICGPAKQSEERHRPNLGQMPAVRVVPDMGMGGFDDQRRMWAKAPYGPVGGA